MGYRLMGIDRDRGIDGHRDTRIGTRIVINRQRYGYRYRIYRDVVRKKERKFRQDPVRSHIVPRRIRNSFPSDPIGTSPIGPSEVTGFPIGSDKILFRPHVHRIPTDRIPTQSDRIR